MTSPYTIVQSEPTPNAIVKYSAYEASRVDGGAMSASRAWSWGLSANEKRPMSAIPSHSPTSVRAGGKEHEEPHGAADVHADDQRLAADPIRQPPSDERHRDGEDDQHAVHETGRRLVRPRTWVR